MIIKRLILHKYSRIALTNLSTITIYPNKNMTILIGTGGIGKSSIIKEMSPIPADLKQYGEEGYKEIEIEYRGELYRLLSEKRGNNHSFFKGDINLNTGGTRKQQLMLVEEHFNYTPMLHDLLLGVKSFTTMSVAERKRWFMLTSNVNYTYSLGVYNRVKERHRDIVANLKLLNNKLTTEKSNSLTEEKINELNDNLLHLNKFLDVLLNSKRNTRPIKENSVDIEELTNQLSKLLERVSGKYNVDTINDRLVSLETELKLVTKQSSTVKDKVDKIKEIERVKYQGGIDKLNREILELEDKINRIKDSIYIDIPFKRTETYLKAIISIYPILTQYLTELYDYRASESYSRRDYKIWCNNLEQLELEYKRVSKLKEELVITDREYEHSKSHTVNCNECGNTIYVSYDKSKHNRVKEELDKACDRLVNLEESIKEYREKIGRYEERYAIIEKINKLSEYPYVGIVLDYLFTKHNVNEDVSVITDTLSKIINDMKEWGKINSLEVELQRLRDDHRVLTNSLGVTKADKKQLEKELVTLLHRGTDIRNEIDICRREKEWLIEIKRLYVTLTTELKRRKAKHRVELSELYNNYINQHIKLVKSSIAEIESKLYDNKYVKEAIGKLEEEVKSLINKEKATKLILQKLSPTEGLIAKSLNSSLNKFLLNINHFVNLTWSYKMEILPCDLDTQGLTYRFPVSVNGVVGASDVNGCSSSQQEIINLGFKLTVMKYLGIEDYPLILDEFARSFDSNHLESAYNLIDMLVTEDKINQILMVSHYSNVYNRFQYATLLTLTKDMEPYRCKEYEYR